MDNNYTTHLKNKSLISVTGDNSKDFLNNIITNDVNKLDKDKSIYSCLLSARKSDQSFFYFYLWSRLSDYD
jgi:folate-binding Fe-S cluster repair protein YgfZ